MLRLKNSKGDTIIEVMVALAVLGLAFAISYATANHALNVSQNSNEHSKASQLLDSQVEMAHTMAGNTDVYSHKQTDAGGDGKWFCFYLDGSNNVQIQAFNPIDNFNPNTQGSQFPANCTSPVNSQVNYYIYDTLNVLGDSAAPDVNQNYFKFNIAWTGLGNLGTQQEQINYKFNKLESFASVGDPGCASGLPGPSNCAPDCASGFSGTWPDCKPINCLGGQVGTPPNCYDPSTFRVVVKKIPLDSGSVTTDRTPSCSNDPTQDQQGTVVSATGPTNANGSTDSASTVILSNLVQGDYNVSVNPSTGYAVCGATSESLHLNEGQTININGFKIRPVCTSYQAVVGSTSQYGVLYYNQVWNPYKYSYWGVVGGHWVTPKWLQRMPPHGYWAWVYGTPYWVTDYGYIYSGGYDYVPVYGWYTVNTYQTRYNCPS